MEVTTPRGRSSSFEHRTLLDVDLDKTQVSLSLALQPVNLRQVQAGLLHGGAHRDAVTVNLVQPAPGQTGRRARPSPENVAL